MVNRKPLDDVSAAAEAERAAEAELIRAKAALQDAVAAAREAGHSWNDVEQAAQIRARVLQGRFERATPSSKRRDKERKEARQKTIRPRKARYADPYPGLSVAATAERLGVSTVTVYEWERSGRLKGYRDAVETAGKLRIVGGEGLEKDLS